MFKLGKPKNIYLYNQSMQKSIEDKIFFLDFLPKYEVIFVDFGCADGSLINNLVNNTKYNNLNHYIGYDISEEMIKIAKTNFNGNAKNVIFTSDWNVVNTELDNPYKKKILILSSVIHEVYSYAGSYKDIKTFWNRVLNSGFDYICVRDMMCSSDLNRNCAPVYQNCITSREDFHDQVQSFQDKWGNFDNMKNVVHFLLKYRWKVNWDRELNENYFPITIEEFLKIMESYNLNYFKRFRIPFLDNCIEKDFGLTLQDHTHIKAIFEKKLIE